MNYTVELSTDAQVCAILYVRVSNEFNTVWWLIFKLTSEGEAVKNVQMCKSIRQLITLRSLVLAYTKHVEYRFITASTT